MKGVIVDHARLVIGTWTTTADGKKGAFGPYAWRPSPGLPAPSEPAKLPDDWSTYLKGGIGHLTLAGPGVAVRVDRYNPTTAEFVVTMLDDPANANSKLDIAVKKDDGRLALLGELRVGSVALGGLGLVFFYRLIFAGRTSTICAILTCPHPHPHTPWHFIPQSGPNPLASPAPP